MKTLLEHLPPGAADVGDLSGYGRDTLWVVSAGACVGAVVAVGAVAALRYFVRPPTKERIPETISPENFATRAFQTSHGQMFYHEGGAGPGPTLVFIHNVGVGASAYQWSKVYPAFAENHRVIAADLLGFGESERPRAKLTALDYAQSLAEFIGGVCGDDARRPMIVSRGLGGGFVTLMAAIHPDLAARLLLWMPSGQANVPFWLKLASRVPNLNSYVYRNKLARRATIRARFEADGAFVDPAAVTPECVDMHAICAQQLQADYAIFRLFQGKMGFDLAARFPELQIPATLLWPARLAGGQAFAGAERLVAANPLCTLRVVPDAGPYAPLEAPDRVIAVLQEELRAENAEVRMQNDRRQKMQSVERKNPKMVNYLRRHASNSRFLHSAFRIPHSAFLCFLTSAFCILHSAFSASADPDWRALVNTGQLVEVTKIDPTIKVELRYATTRNCIGAAVYPADLPCLIRPEIALRLKAAQQFLRGWNYGLKIWDAYRPTEAQRALWKRWAKRGFVADPGDGRGSLHTWGLAVDVTLVDRFGNDVEMPSDFDVFTDDASGIYRGKSDTVHHNLRLLQRAMFGSGFQGLSTEWWHFTARGWDKFDRLTADSTVAAKPAPSAPDRKPPPAAAARSSAAPLPPTPAAPIPAPPKG